MLKLLFCLLVYHVYEGNTVSEEIISFWEQVLNEGLSFFFNHWAKLCSLKPLRRAIWKTCWAAPSAFLRFVIFLDWAGLFCESSLASTCQFKVLRRARELKDYSGSFEFLTRAAQSASRMTTAHINVYKTVWVSLRAVGAPLTPLGCPSSFEFLLSPASDRAEVVVSVVTLIRFH